MSSYQSFSDLELTRNLTAGEEQAFAEIFNRYWKEMYQHALQVVEDEDAAKDIVQEMFVKIWQNSADLQIDTNLAGYLYTATRSRVLNYLRARKTQGSFLAALERRIQHTTLTPIEAITEKETAHEIESTIGSLPGKMKEIFELSRKENLSHKEIATELRITVHTVKKQINRALKIIRFRLS